jgi:hypothetical protein
MHHSTHLISISELEHILQDDAVVLHFKRFLQNPEGPSAETDILEAAESSNKDNREYPIQHTLKGASSSRSNAWSRCTGHAIIIRSCKQVEEAEPARGYTACLSTDKMLMAGTH